MKSLIQVSKLRGSKSIHCINCSAVDQAIPRIIASIVKQANDFSLFSTVFLRPNSALESPGQAIQQSMPLSAPAYRGSDTVGFGVELPDRLPSLQKLPLAIHMGSSCLDHLSRVRSDSICSPESYTQVILRSRAENNRLRRVASLWALQMGKHRFLKIIPSTRMGMIAVHSSAGFGGGMHYRGNNRAAVVSCDLNRFRGNLFFDLCLSGAAWKMIYETHRWGPCFAAWGKRTGILTGKPKSIF